MISRFRARQAYVPDWIICSDELTPLDVRVYAALSASVGEEFDVDVLAAAIYAGSDFVWRSIDRLAEAGALVVNPHEVRGALDTIIELAGDEPIETKRPRG